MASGFGRGGGLRGGSRWQVVYLLSCSAWPDRQKQLRGGKKAGASFSQTLYLNRFVTMAKAATGEQFAGGADLWRRPLGPVLNLASGRSWVVPSGAAGESSATLQGG